MSTNYPTGIDHPTNPVAGDQLDDPDHASQHIFANDAIVALETFVGTEGNPNFVGAGEDVGGDLSGTVLAPTVARLKTIPLGDLSGIATGQSLVYNGSELVPGATTSVGISGSVAGSLGITGSVPSSVVTGITTTTSVDGSAEELGGDGPNPAVWGLKFNANTVAGSGLFFIGWIYGGGTPMTSGDFTLPSGWDFIACWTDGTYYTYFVCAATDHAEVTSSTTLDFTVNTGTAVYGAAKIVAIPGLGSQALTLDGTPTATVKAGSSLAAVTSGGLSGLTGTNDIIFAICATTSSSADLSAASMAGMEALPVWAGSTYGSPGCSFVAESMGDGAIPQTTINFTATDTTEAGVGMVAIAFDYTTGGGGTYTADLPDAYLDLIADDPVFFDNFAGTSLNSTNWNNTYFGGAGVVGLASTSAANVTVDNGLTLTLSSDGGNPTNPDLDAGVGACVSTYGKFTFNQGYIQAIMTLPDDGTGYVANWGGLYTASYTQYSNELDEIDVNETLNVYNSADYSENAAPRTSLHTLSGGDYIAFFSATPSGSYAGTQHTYGALWNGNTVTFFIDGAVVESYSGTQAGGTLQHIIYLVEGQAEIYAGKTVVGAAILVAQIAYWPLASGGSYVDSR